MNLLTAAEVAEILRVNKARVYELARLKMLPALTLGQRQLRFEEGALREWIAAGGSSREGMNTAGRSDPKEVLSKEQQLSLGEDSLVRYSGSLWIVSRRINENQIVIYPACLDGRHTTVAVTDRLLSIPKAAELLAPRLTGSLAASAL